MFFTLGIAAVGFLAGRLTAPRRGRYPLGPPLPGLTPSGPPPSPPVGPSAQGAQGMMMFPRTFGPPRMY